MVVRDGENMFFSKIRDFICTRTSKSVNNNITKKFWIKLFTVVLVIVILIMSFNTFLRIQCRTIGGRDIFFDSIYDTVNFSEKASLVKIDITQIEKPRLDILPVDVYKHQKKVEFYGYQADIYYVFWHNELTWVYFFINTGSNGEFISARNDINSKLQNEFDGAITDNGVFSGIPKKFSTLFDGQMNDLYSFLAPSPTNIKSLELRSAAFTGVECGKNYFPTNKEIWELLTEKPYKSLIDENTLVVEYDYWIESDNYLETLKSALDSML